MLKKMEDANRNQLEVLRGQQQDMHVLANALVGQTSEVIKKRVEQSISEFMSGNDNVKSEIAKQIGDKILSRLGGAFGEAK
jgi:replicative superfamily II helicase